MTAEDGAALPTADLSGLKDGQVTVSAVVTDDADNSKLVPSGAPLTLDLDTMLDADNSLTLTLPDTVINDSEKGTVSVNLSGQEDDIKTVTVTFRDGEGNTHTVTAEDGAALPAAD
ncbi:hypothetical protein, partial [Veronia pacifica]|uniref:hypothetical protein n=1 Tax=Veronia pacifica TaxID=1080227 RepID=UPI003630E240